MELAKLVSRFPRTQMAIHAGMKIADATVLTDNSRPEKQAITVCRVPLGNAALYDRRTDGGSVLVAIVDWLEIVSPVAS
ncbi:hypothetical protein HHL26_23200 [Sphingobium sp. TB-6]|uniref:hypothetical protein n=1 Tax=Sphingobium sp. TB-6 TaxID=2728850 RepID=UPI00146F69D5|nr:hypothetical protein [Sphingobium sp. TB-6]NML91914.1 hypothetical protein [Sphingobium sp. TB-6]